jgi:[protein-PII] uridylyltransferase
MTTSERLSAPPASKGCLDLVALQDFERLSTGTAGSGDSRLSALRDLIRNSLKAADEKLAKRFWAGEDVVQLVRARAWVVEQLLLLAWRMAAPKSHYLCLVAVGGYGRGELHPQSDVDLLVLLDDDTAADLPQAEIESFVRLLWDAGFYLGHSVRSVKECVEESEKDVVTATTMMESRLLTGPPALFRQFRAAISVEHLWPAKEFFAAKYAEQQERHARYHETAYNLEPNIKEGPGGLRDIQMIGWVARRHFGSQTLYGLVENGFLTEEEHSDLVQDQRFLWRVRYALHLLAGRAEDRLLFDFQRQVAMRFGYEDGENNLAVERFMQSYYRAVMQLERLNERLLQLFQEELLYAEDETTEPLGEDYRTRHGIVEVRDEHLFVRRPQALMEIFVLLAHDPELKGLGASTIRLIRDHLYLVDEEFIRDEEVNRLFLELLRQPQGVYTQLQRMNRYGLLAAYIPAFSNIVGRMHYDLFHVYTVDQHTLFVVRNLRRFAYGKYRNRFPHARSVFKRIERPELLYLAALFHDIAKGRGGDHSELGAVDAQVFCARMDIEDEDREMIRWLVENHLSMSLTAQRKDLSDPATVNDFAVIVANTRYLDYLYLLTVADIAATSPKLWNSWKNSLIWELYLAAGTALRRGLENPLEAATRIRETRSRTLSRLLRRGLPAVPIAQVWNPLPEHAFLRLTADQLEWATEIVVDSGDSDSQIAVREVRARGVSELLVCVPDYDGLFAAITSVLDEMGLNVLSARILTTNNGRSFDLFQLMDQRGGAMNAADENELVSRLTVAAVAGEKRAPVSRTLPRRLRHFSSPPVFHFSEHPDGNGTVMELECNDSPGLLSRVAAAMVEEGIQVHDARIATFGERVEDTFLLSDAARKPLTETARQALASSLKAHLARG